MDNIQNTEDIAETCVSMLDAAGIKYILLINPDDDLRELLEWAWRRKIDGNGSCSFQTDTSTAPQN